jgi:hypothetical protein
MRTSHKIAMLSALALGLQIAVAHAQTAYPDGARPGNDIGTRDSYPLSPYASNITPGDTKSVIAPTPPEPNVAPNANAEQLLVAALQSLSNGQTGTADEALEQAETNILDRSVPQTQTDYTNNDPIVSQITQARTTLGYGNIPGTTQIIHQILSTNASELYQ